MMAYFVGLIHFHCAIEQSEPCQETYLSDDTDADIVLSFGRRPLIRNTHAANNTGRQLSQPGLVCIT